jgi:site-specific DNA recombinase
MDKPTNPFRVAAYARVSTMNQVYEHDSSVDTQVSRIRQRVAYETEQARHTRGRPWVLTSEYREEGKSGKDTDRPALQRLLADIRSGHVDAVCVTKIDRITRSLIDFYELWRTFEQHNVEFVSLGESFETASATGRAMLKLTLVFAELERERTSERTREKIEMRRRAGLWFGGVPPLGYKSHLTDKTTIVVDEAQKEIVRLIYDRYLELGSARAVTKYLAQRGVKSPARKTTRGATRGGRMFTTSSVMNVLTNSAYTARRDRGDGVLVECNWEPIIDEATFDRAQRRLKQNSDKRPTGRESVDHEFLLEGILRCGLCGSSMVRAIGTGKSGTAYFYYRCSRKHKTAFQGCTARDVPAKNVEKFVLDHVAEYSVDTARLRKSVTTANAGRDTALANLTAELADVDGAYALKKKQIAKVLDMLESEDAGDLSTLKDRLRSREAELAEITERKADLIARRDALHREVLEADTVAAAYAQIPHLFADAQSKGADKELHALLRAIIDQVEWRPNPDDPKSGEALIQMFPLPRLFTPPAGVNQEAGCSSGCLEWLRWGDGVRTDSPGRAEKDRGPRRMRLVRVRCPR